MSSRRARDLRTERLRGEEVEAELRLERSGNRSAAEAGTTSNLSVSGRGVKGGLARGSREGYVGDSFCEEAKRRP